MTRAILPNKVGSTNQGILYMAIELSHKTWKLAFSEDQGGQFSERDVTARDLEGLRSAVKKTKAKFEMAADARVVSCYEAGRDGFWLDRFLKGEGIENVIVDSASIEVSRRFRRVKTDRIDAMKLLEQLMRYHAGENRALKVVRGMSVQDEDDRRMHRERARLLKEYTSLINRIRSLLITQGVVVSSVVRLTAEKIEELKQYDGTGLPRGMKAELGRLLERLQVAKRHRQQVDKELRHRVQKKETGKDQKAAQLATLRGVGLLSAIILVMEMFGCRRFRTRRQVGAYGGMTGTPYSSGASNRDQGISKAGNRHVRALMVELAWQWLRYQPNSKLSQWYNQRFAGGGGRIKRIGIVALARKLLVALWKFAEFGEAPEGAEFKRLPAPKAAKRAA